MTAFRTPEPSKADNVLYTWPATPATPGPLSADNSWTMVSLDPAAAPNPTSSLKKGSCPHGTYSAATDSQISIPLVVSFQTGRHRLVERDCDRVSVLDYDDSGSSCEALMRRRGYFVMLTSSSARAESLGCGTPAAAVAFINNTAKRDALGKPNRCNFRHGWVAT